ncbi:MAG: TetR/AcrR family transcriptional regulator [Clostridia bacterium]|nr:TetR/AcrR family transcriptional regulator [Deltaproteobacteria bacterium]
MTEGQTRSRILTAASELLTRSGIEALTTRAVAAAAKVQAPALYRLFGDKRGLLEAVAEQTLADYVSVKAHRTPHRDPVHDLRVGWDEHIAFCLEHPAVFALMTGSGHDGPPSRAASKGLEVLRARVHRIARAGRLRVREERAVGLLHAAGTGVVSSLLSTDARENDKGLAKAALEATLDAILTNAPTERASDEAAHATALRAALPDVEILSPGERLLLAELLDKIAAGRG